jgi:hypothetical protein
MPRTSCIVARWADDHHAEKYVRRAGGLPMGRRCPDVAIAQGGGMRARLPDEAPRDA